MDWALAIKHNHGALMRLVAAIFAVVGIVPGGGPVSSMSKPMRASVLRMLRPAEAALRRLITLAAQEIRIRLRAQRAGLKRAFPKGVGTSDRIPPFALFDPRKWFSEMSQNRRPLRGPGPQISGFHDGSWTPRAGKPAPTDIDPASLCRRLQSLQRALENIPAEAKRLARVQSRRRAANEPIKRTEPLRPGWPPGHRKHPTHDVDEILNDCHVLARIEPKPPNLSAVFDALV